MSRPAALHLEKACKLLRTAQELAINGFANDAGRGAYLAVYHAAQAYIADHTGRVAKTHNGTHTQFAQLAALEPRIDARMRSFLPEAYNLKAVADYEFGTDAEIPIGRAVTAVEEAARFVDRIAALLQGHSQQPEATGP
jgi:uncharacterized protein (UPF0332 family)